jgi:cellulose synthase/poly-beta-1,6-N-acetylglucosamine synthase-like glycosyltransferase/peptidoglycan/xylan/chitin deacetylase (PgdA/CDA1 family)/spore germination protein YaaH
MGRFILFICVCIIVVFVIDLSIVPQIQHVNLGAIEERTLNSLPDSEPAVPALLSPAASLAAQVRSTERNIWWLAHSGTGRIAPLNERSKPTDAAAVRKPLSIGFYANWDDRSFTSLKAHLADLDWVMPTWLTIRGVGMAIEPDLDAKALELIRRARPTMPILPLLQNVVDGRWDGKNLALLLADPEARRARLSEIVAFLDANKLQGLTVDFEGVPRSAHRDLQKFLAEMADAFRPRGWRIVLCVPFNDEDWNYGAYANLADFLLLMAYDEHWEEGAPGSIAGQPWFESVLNKRMKELDPARTIVAIGSYGYDWSQGQNANEITFQDAMRIAQVSGAHIAFDREAANPNFSYAERGGKRHELWFLDGATAFNEMQAADMYRPAGYALWRLGSEDQSIWSIMEHEYGALASAGLSTINPGGDFYFQGKGEILSIVGDQSAGARSISVDPLTGAIDNETYTKFPAAYVIQRLGNQPGKVALTFDDGPDPKWTPKILDILKAKGARASFFIIGQNAEASPGLLRRMVREGHDVGNHTFTHPNLTMISDTLLTLELNATQRLFQAFTGRSMRLFRPPYLGDAEPTSTQEIAPIETAQSMGYLTVGLHIDPNDWQRPPADLIVQRVIDGAGSTDPSTAGQIVLLHDAGGDRSQTVAALPALIDALRAKGYQIVPVSELVGLTPEEAMPVVPEGSLRDFVDLSVFLSLGWFGQLLRATFIGLICLGLARFAFLTVLCLINRWREYRRPAPGLPEVGALVSVIIPAHNEAKVIATTVERILESDYKRLEVVVVENGSSDGTSAVVRARFGKNPRVSLITLPDGGKANAINVGLARTQADIIVALDADTQFAHDTISKLVRWFVDPTVGAVAGNTRVGNHVNMITRWQALEYITAQNLERRALYALGCVTVVPGAVGAWRRVAFSCLGGYPVDTLAEDQDLTIAIQKAGFKVVFDDEAIALTEAPDTWRGLARQRFRWAFGTLQCLWKHHDATGRPRYGALGLVALPQVWLFQIVYSLLSPLADLLFLSQIVATAIDYFQHGNEFDPTNAVNMMCFYALFLLTDLGAGVLGLAMEKGAKWSLLWWVLLQRFGYRQLMYYVVLKSVIKAVSGSSVGWDKLQRKGTVAAAAPQRIALAQEHRADGGDEVAARLRQVSRSTLI